MMNKVVSRMKSRNPANDGQPLGTSNGKDSSVFEGPIAPTHLISANTGNPQQTPSRCTVLLEFMFATFISTPDVTAQNWSFG